MKIAYLAHPSANKDAGMILTQKLRKMGWVILNPFEQEMRYQDIPEMDLSMIDKADYVIVYYPEKIFSFGVPIETYYANRQEKYIFILTTDDILSYPFVQKYTNPKRQFTNEEKFLLAMKYITD